MDLGVAQGRAHPRPGWSRRGPAVWKSRQGADRYLVQPATQTGIRRQRPGRVHRRRRHLRARGRARPRLSDGSGTTEELRVHAEIGQRIARARGAARASTGCRPRLLEQLELKPDDESRDVTVTLRRARPCPSACGRAGRPRQRTSSVSRSRRRWPTWIAWHWWRSYFHGTVRDGRFTVHGLADDAEVPVFFLDARRGLGAMARLSGRSAANGPVTVRLEPLGAVRFRPSPGSRPDAIFTAMVVTPGPSLRSQDKADLDQLCQPPSSVVELQIRSISRRTPVAERPGMAHRARMRFRVRPTGSTRSTRTRGPL